jgi:hypothetical protein
MDTVDENVPFRSRAIVQKFWLTKSRTVERNGKAEGRLLDVARNTTKLAPAEQVLEDDGETRVQNATERVSRIGPSAEALRRIHVQRLRSHLDAFYEHGTLTDVLLLSAAFDEAERDYRAEQMRDRACLVESLLRVLGICPQRLTPLDQQHTRDIAEMEPIFRFVPYRGA